MGQHQTVRKRIEDRPMITIGWHVVGLVKDKDGARSLRNVTPKLFVVKSAAEALMDLANRTDADMKAYLVEVKTHGVV